MIELRHVRKSFPDATPLRDVNVTIRKGDVISVIGPSGSGKSVLLRCINMLGAPTSGQIFVDGEDVTAKGYDITKVRKKIGMVFQSFNLFSHLTVIENIMNPQIKLLGRSRKEAYDKAMILLAKVGLASKYAKYPDELSGGQKQRVAICRTLALDPEIILFDEPTSALDPTMVGEVQSVIRDLANEGRTMMIVTHEMKFARAICNRVFYIDEGGIYEDGTPEQIFEAPEREKTRIFINQIKTLEIESETGDFDVQSVVYRLEEYGHNNLMERRLIYRILSTFDELCGQILLPHLRFAGKLKLSVAFYQEKSETVLTVLYTGESFDPRESDNLIALRILQNSTSGIEYRELRDGEYTNRVDVRF